MIDCRVQWAMVVAFAGLLAGACGAQSGASQKVPVLVELFTSEGCSSCPPADEMLANIRNMQPMAGEEIYVLSEHVDYWDHEGWKDRFSLHQATERQNLYGQWLKFSEAYTPQMVVDGTIEFNGSDAVAAQNAFNREQTVAKVPITVSRVDSNSAEMRVKVDVGEVAAHADLMMATADEDVSTTVKAGENHGKTLHHVNVMRSLEKVGSVKPEHSLSREVKIKRVAGEGSKQAAIFFLQDAKSGRVLGVSSITLTP